MFHGLSPAAHTAALAIHETTLPASQRTIAPDTDDAQLLQLTAELIMRTNPAEQAELLAYWDRLSQE